MNMIKFIVLMLLSQIAIAQDAFTVKTTGGVYTLVCGTYTQKQKYEDPMNAHNAAVALSYSMGCKAKIKATDIEVDVTRVKSSSPSSAQSSSSPSVTLTGGRPNLREDGSILLPEKILGYHFKVGSKSVILQTQPGETFSYNITFYVGPTDEALIATISTDNPPLYSDYVNVPVIKF